MVQELAAVESPRCLAVVLIVRNQCRDPSLFSPKLFSVATLQIIFITNTTMIINATMILVIPIARIGKLSMKNNITMIAIMIIVIVMCINLT